MKILLTAINAKYIHSNLAVYSLQAYAEAQGHKIERAEYTINNQLDDILEKIYCQKPDVLIFSCYIWNIEYVRELAAEFHKLRPEVPIWVGGPEVSFETERFLKENPAITGIMMGEGERTLTELCTSFEQESSLEKIDGISYRRGDGTVAVQPLRSLLPMDELPFCYANLQDFEHRIIYYESSRGCPFSCSYCLSSVDKKLRFRSLPLVYRELQFFIDAKVPQVKFVDRTFNCRHEHAMGIWNYIKEHDNGITNFHFEISADLLREDELELISDMRPGLIQLEIGVQSTNGATIREIHRTMRLEDVYRAVNRVKAGKNIHQHLDLIAGLPFEDYERFQQSFDDIYALHPQQLQLGFLKVLKGSFMYQAAPEYGCVCQSREPYEVLYTRWLPYDDVLRLKLVEEMVEVYYNSNQFGKTLRAIEKLFDNPFALYEALGAFYDKKGYMDISHTRIRRYEILQEFLQEYVDEEQMDYYRQLMICDLYARENMKTRPAWAKDLKAYKRDIREFYLKEEETHEYLPEYEGYDEKQLARMTHLERMDYDPDTGVREPCWILFDYRSRDVLTYDAKMVKLSLVDIMQK